MLSLFCLFFSFALSNLTPLSECEKATVTYYSGYGAETVACHLGTQNLDSMFRAAPNEQFYLSSQQCGICYEAIGEKGSIRFMVSDLCPANGNSDWCASSKTHFDLAENAFPKICDPIVGHCDITYRMVACDVQGNVKLFTKAGVSNYWIGFYVRNYVVGLKGVSITFGENTRVLTRTTDNSWLYQVPDGETSLTTPITVTLTSIAGDTATITMNDITSDKLYEGNGQFKIPEKTFFEPETLNKINAPSSTQECCTMPSVDIIFTDSLQSFWALINGGSVSVVQDIKYSGTSSLKAVLSAWGNFQISSKSHTVLIQLYDTLQFYVKSSSTATLWFWEIGKDNTKAKTIDTTTDWQLVSFKVSEIGNQGTSFPGIEFQSKTNGQISFYFDDIKMIATEGSCNQICSDHTPSGCDPINPGDNENNNSSNSMLMITLLLMIHLIL